MLLPSSRLGHRPLVFDIPYHKCHIFVCVLSETYCHISVINNEVIQRKYLANLVNSFV